MRADRARMRAELMPVVIYERPSRINWALAKAKP